VRGLSQIGEVVLDPDDRDVDDFWFDEFGITEGQVVEELQGEAEARVRYGPKADRAFWERVCDWLGEKLRPVHDRDAWPKVICLMVQEREERLARTTSGKGANMDGEPQKTMVLTGGLKDDQFQTVDVRIEADTVRPLLHVEIDDGLRSGGPEAGQVKVDVDPGHARRLASMLNSWADRADAKAEKRQR
jgi:hypothetical protein